MTDEQRAARRRVLQQCEQVLSAYLTDFLDDSEDAVDGFEDVDSEIDGLRCEVIAMEIAT